MATNPREITTGKWWLVAKSQTGYSLREGHIMEFSPDTPFFRLLATKYDPAREGEAIRILTAHPEIATLEWPGPDEKGQLL